MKYRFLLVSLAAVCLMGTLTAARQTSAARAGRLRQAADRAMTGLQGTVVVLDVESGRLLAAHRPDIAARRRERPGSTVKPFTLMAMLDAGVVRPKTTLMCRKRVRISDRNLDCSHVDVPEPIDGSLALAYSCNYFFTHMAEMLSADSLANTFRQAGLASRTGLAASEISGVVQRPGTRESLQLMAVGEEGVQVTPLGLASAYRRLALRVRNGDATTAAVVDGLKGAVKFGTAQRAGSGGGVVAGKTGSSTSQDRAGRHAWFAGFAPAERPEIVVVVFIERGSGGADAAPVAGRLFEAYR